MNKNVVAFILCFFLAGLLCVFVSPSCDWDLLSYHYYNGFAIFNERIGSDFFTGGIQSYFNPFLDMIDYLIMSSFDNKYITSFILGYPLGLLCFALYLINKKLFFSNIVILISLLLSLTETFILSERVTSFHDIVIAAFILYSVYFLMKFINSKQSKYIVYSGLFSGFACGCKLTAVPFALSVLIAGFIFINSKDIKKYLSYLFIFIISSSFSFMLIDGYWMFLLYKYYHNPFFPLFNKIFKSEFFTQVNYRDYRFINQNWLEALYYPLVWSDKEKHIASEVPFFDIKHGMMYFCFLISSILLVFKRILGFFSKTDKQYLFIIVFVLISYLLWFKIFGILRYLIPILSLSGIIITMTVVQICKYNKNIASLNITVLFIILCLGIVFQKTPCWGRAWDVLTIPVLPIKSDSVVLLYGKPISYMAAYPYKKTKFIGLYYAYDGESIDFHPTSKYYDYIDAQITNKNLYIIKSKTIKPTGYAKKYFKDNLKCESIINTTTIAPKHLKPSNFEFCYYD